MTTPVSESESPDYSGRAILYSNGFAILLALYQGWQLYTLLVVYWFQSVIIGGFNVARILKLKQFSTNGLTFNERPVPESKKGKWKIASFFAMHFGFFHLVYFVFLATGSSDFTKSLESEKSLTYEILWIVFAIAGFLVSHLISFRKNVDADLKERPNLGTMMFLPYLRIIPMHLTIIIGGAISSGGWLLIVFMMLKSGADYLMHIAEHWILRRQKESETDNAG